MRKPQLPVSPCSPDKFAGTNQRSVTNPRSKAEGRKEFCQRHFSG